MSVQKLSGAEQPSYLENLALTANKASKGLGNRPP